MAGAGSDATRRPMVTDSTVFHVGIVVSVAATLLTFAITTAESFTVFQVLSATFLIFSASALVLLLVEVRRRSDRTESIVGIVDHLAGSAPGTAAFKEIGQNLTTVLEGYGHQPEIAIAWQTAMPKCADGLEQLAQGHLVTRTSDQTYKLAFLERGLPLRATSLLRLNMHFWTTSDGEEYWNEQLRALRDGQRIERIFIYDQLTDEVETLMRRHADAGVDTFKVSESSLASEDRADITLWGSEAVFYKQFQQRPPGSGPWYDRFSFHSREVTATTKQYERIMKNAQRVLGSDAVD